MKNVLNCTQFTKEELEEILSLASEIKKDPKKYSEHLNGKIVATLFYEPSTRTRLSFESATQRLGGYIISTENAKEMSSSVKGETLTDTIRVLNGYSDVIVMRHSEDNSSEVAASVATVPIINAGAGKGEHPTQALLDIFTIREKKGTLDNLKVAVIGDLLHGRTINSLVKILSIYDNVTVYGLSRSSLKIAKETLEYIKGKNIKYIECSSFEEIPKNTDVLYNTRTQLERFSEFESKEEEYIIDKALLDTFSKDSIVLHPLPRNKEIAVDVDNDPRALFFEQAHNGVFIRMALLIKVFE